MADLPTDDAMNRLAAALERANPPPLKLVGRSLLIGVATGLGATVGVAVLLYLLGRALNGLGYFEPLKPVVSQVQQLLDTAKPPAGAPRR